jgi:hypothetical protein
MDGEACGTERAERLVAAILAAEPRRLPPDIAIYARAAARLLAAQPRARAEAAAARAGALGGLPSRAELLAFCALCE